MRKNFFLLKCNVALTKKETREQVFSCEFCESFKNTFFIVHLRTNASVINLQNPQHISIWLSNHFVTHHSRWNRRILQSHI